MVQNDNAMRRQERARRQGCLAHELEPLDLFLLPLRVTVIVAHDEDMMIKWLFFYNNDVSAVRMCVLVHSNVSALCVCVIVNDVSATQALPCSRAASCPQTCPSTPLVAHIILLLPLLLRGPSPPTPLSSPRPPPSRFCSCGSLQQRGEVYRRAQLMQHQARFRTVPREGANS